MDTQDDQGGMEGAVMDDLIAALEAGPGSRELSDRVLLVIC